MDRKKPPALTSPWKVGFLVALMLVVTGLGVAYFISGSFGLKWTWIEFGGLSPTEWVFNLPAFIDQMVPLVALVLLLASASYGLVAGAVRRYKAFVDSGSDYKQLLRSIKSFEDLEDEELLDSLKQHPELREFLMGFKNRLAARERQLSERGKRGPSTRDQGGTTPRSLPAESSVLVNAIMNGADGLSRELALTIPELKQIERVVRERIAHAPQPAPVPVFDRAAEAALEGVRDQVVAVRRDAGACITGARDMESLLVSLKKAVDASHDPAVATEGVAATTRQMDSIADTLATLGEETRRIAIAAALHASGNGSEGDAIKVAEDVRSIATRFNGVAQQWKDVGPALRTAVDTMSRGMASTGKHRATLSAAAGAAASKANLWSERIVALLEQIRELEEAAGVESAMPAESAEEPAEWGVIDASLTESETGTATAAADVDVDVDVDIDVAPAGAFETVTAGGAATSAAEFEEDAPFADIPGVEKDAKIFSGEQAAATAEAASGERIEVDHEPADDWRVQSAADEIAALGTASETAEDSAPADDGFLTGPRGKPAQAGAGSPAQKQPERDAVAELEPRPAALPKAAAPKPQPPAPKTRPAVEAERAVATMDADADAIDLYAYGAVDYVEGVHA